MYNSEDSYVPNCPTVKYLSNLFFVRINVHGRVSGRSQTKSNKLWMKLNFMSYLNSLKLEFLLWSVMPINWRKNCRESFEFLLGVYV